MPKPYLFPAETLLVIFADMDIATLKSLRLTCKSFCGPATEILFNEVVLQLPIPDSLDKFDKILSHPTYHKLVQAFYYNANTLRNDMMSYTGIMSIKRWKADMGNNPHGGLGDSKELGAIQGEFRRQSRKKKMRTHFRRFCQRVAEGTVETERLAALFSRIPQLERVELGYPFVKFTDSIVQETLSCPNPIGNTDDGRERHLKSLVTAADESRVVFRSFTVRGTGQRYFREYFNGSMPAPHFLPFLRHLILEIPLDEEDSPSFRSDAIRGLALSISDSPDLETLDLTFRDMHPTLELARLEDVLSVRSHWPSLKTVRLSTLEATAQFFMTFLEEHSSTLKSLTLKDMTFPKCSILTLLKRMRKNLSLEKVSLEGKLSNYCGEGWVAASSASPDDCTKAKIENFVIHGGEFPLQVPKYEIIRNWGTLEKFKECVVFNPLPDYPLVAVECCRDISVGWVGLDLGHIALVREAGDASWYYEPPAPW